MYYKQPPKFILNVYFLICIGSCVDAGFTTCCINIDDDGCQGLPPVCSCSLECHSLGTCCPDIDVICNAQSPSQGP